MLFSYFVSFASSFVSLVSVRFVCPFFLYRFISLFPYVRIS